MFEVQAAAVLGEQVRALPDDKIKQLWLFFFEGLWWHNEIKWDAKYGLSMTYISASCNAINLEILVSLVEIIRETTRKDNVVQAFDTLFLSPSSQNIESGFRWEWLFRVFSLNLFFDFFWLRRIHHIDYLRLMTGSERRWSNRRRDNSFSYSISHCFFGCLLVLVLPHLLIYLISFLLYLGKDFLSHG